MAWRTYEQKLNSRYVELKDMPSQNTEYTLNFYNLYGGLNIQKLDYELDSKESPEMENLVWRDGVLTSRYGQVWVNNKSLGTGYTMFDQLWRDYLFCHIGNKIYAFDPQGWTLNLTKSGDYNVTINSDTWRNYVPADGTYVFTYDNANATWKLSGTAVSLETYGIGVTELPDDGDTITVVYYDGYIEVKYADTSSLNLPTIRGTFFQYNNKLYYKTRGAYIGITATRVGTEWSFTAENVATNAYVPTIILNASPTNGAGDTYQPENRLSSKKNILYTSAENFSIVSNNANLNLSIESTAFKRRIAAQGTYVFTHNGSSWTYGGSSVALTDYGIECSGTPSNGNTITVTNTGVKNYYLPVKGKNLVEVKVDGNTLVGESITTSKTAVGVATVSVDMATWKSAVPGTGTTTFVYSGQTERHYWTRNGSEVNLATYGVTITLNPGRLEPVDGDIIYVTYAAGDYEYDFTNGIVKFRTAPPVSVPPAVNTVSITYDAPNTTAYNNIMDCRFVKVHGGTGSLCITMAGSTTQPNAYFWNGQTSVDMDASYFPTTQYQLAGDSWDEITGFGLQQSYLIIFKAHSIGRSTLDTTEINDRTYIDLPYVPINDKIGCDLPWTIQLIDNNLVWANTEQGVHFLNNTSAAYENNITCLSNKVNGSKILLGVLSALRIGDKEKICANDDTRHYWLNAGDKAWLWNYEITTYTDPSWFYQTGIKAVAYAMENEDIYHMDELGRITTFQNNYSDYGGAINKIFRFATQYFNTYDRLKNVNSVMINMRGDMDTETKVTYITDYEERDDLMPLLAKSWHLVPRNLAYRFLGGAGFASTFRRRPFCRHVRHFTMRLSNNIAGQNLSIVSVQVFYNYQGRYRGSGLDAMNRS